jgi:cell division protein FtsI/penicillin-binding protein 2
MIATVDDTDTFRSYSNPNYSVGIKTGTAQMAKPTGGYFDDKFLHSMVGFVPAQGNQNERKFTILIYNIDPQGARYSSTTLKEQMFTLTEFLINYYQISPDRLQLDSI